MMQSTDAGATTPAGAGASAAAPVGDLSVLSAAAEAAMAEAKAKEVLLGSGASVSAGGPPAATGV